jgi:hypothetical protein
MQRVALKMVTAELAPTAPTTHDCAATPVHVVSTTGVPADWLAPCVVKHLPAGRLSRGTLPGGVAETVTGFDVLPVAPTLSVTVSATV